MTMPIITNQWIFARHYRAWKSHSVILSSQQKNNTSWQMCTGSDGKWLWHDKLL